MEDDSALVQADAEQAYLLVVDPKGLLADDVIAALTRRCAVEIDATATPESLAHRIQHACPDVVLLGIDDTASLAAIQHIPTTNGKPRLIAIASEPSADVVAAAMKAGCDGFIFNTGTAQSVADTVAATLTAVPPAPAPIAADMPPASPASAASDARTTPLTERERQVLSLLADGHSTKQIASMLSLSGKTIETHRLRIMRKLKLFSVAELTKYAIRHGLTRI